MSHIPRSALAPRTALVNVACLVALSGCGATLASPPPPVRLPGTPSATAATTAAPSATGIPSASPGPAETPAPTALTVACSNALVLATWPTTRLAAQTVAVPVNEAAAASVTPEVAAGAGGVLLFGSNAPPSLRLALARLDAAAPNAIAPLVMTDEEGGDVQRMANLVGAVPSARFLGATLSPGRIRQLAAGLARRMRAAGVTMDLAPVLDVDGGAGPNSRNPDGTRSFSADARTVAADGLAFAAGLEDGGVVPVVKHFPGLGGATGNSDFVTAATRPWTVLQGSGLLPFTAAVDAQVPAVMVANASVPGLTSLPASVSHAVITSVLRERLGFQGLVMTDTLSATALRVAGYSVPTAAVAALGAGADMVLFNAEPAAVAGLMGGAVAAVAGAVDAGTLDRSRLVDAVAHILAAKRVNLCA